jgi:hypothetical protein
MKIRQHVHNVLGCVLGLSLAASTSQAHDRIHSIDGLLEQVDLAVVAVPTSRQATLDREDGSADLFDVMTVITPILSRGNVPAEGEALLTWRGRIVDEHISTTGHVPHLEDGQPYVLFLSESASGDGTWRIVSGDQGAFRIVRDQSDTDTIYPMRFESRGILNVSEDGMLQLTPTLGGITDGLAWSASTLESSMAPTPTIAGPNAVGARTKSFWQSGEIMNLMDFVKVLASHAGSLDPDVSESGLSEALHDIPASSVDERGGLVDLCICDRWSLFLVFQVLPEDYWAYWKDQYAMWFFNEFMDIYRYIDSDGTWSTGNGVNEFAGWIDSSTLDDATGEPWDGAIGLTINRKPTGCDCCWLIESDVFYNPEFNWRNDIDDTFDMFDSHDRVLYEPIQMHELGHTFGYMSDGIGSTTCQETYNYDRHSIMHAYYDDIVETGEGIHRTDSVLLRNAYEDQTILNAIVDVGCESYYVSSSGSLSSSYMYPQCPDPGETVTLYSVVMENMTYGWGLQDVEMRVYLSPGNHNITTSDRLVATLTWSDLNPETWWEGDVSFVWPDDLEHDTYWIGLMMYLPENSNPDEWHTDNNTTWMSMQCPGNPSTPAPTCSEAIYWPLNAWELLASPVWIPWIPGLQDSDPPLDLPCGGETFYGPDTWFKLNTPNGVDGIVDIMLDGGLNDDVIALYEADGACAGESPVAVVCYTGGAHGGGGPAFDGETDPVSLRAPVAGGNTYLVRVGSLSGESMGGMLQIKYDLAGIPGDLPHLAVPMQHDVFGDLSDNTSGGPGDPCAPNFAISEWHAWEAPASGTAHASTCHASTNVRTAMAVYMVSDSGGLEFVDCGGDSGTACGFEIGSDMFWEAQSGVKYLLRIGATDNSGLYMLNIGLEADAPINDSCTSMQGMSDGVHPFNTLGASSDLLSGCGGNIETAGIWFKYITDFEGYVTFSTCPDDGGSAEFKSQIFAMDGSDCSSVIRCSKDCGADSTTLSMWVTAGSHPVVVGGETAFGVFDRGDGELAVELDRRCIGDADGSGDVKIDDLLVLVGSWGTSNPMADFDNDGVVKINDLLMLLDRFGCSS